MKLAATSVAPLRSAMMETDRKRPANQSTDELAPPTKRQAVNGSSKNSNDADMPWKEDLEVSVMRPFTLHICAHFYCLLWGYQSTSWLPESFLINVLYMVDAHAQLAVNSTVQLVYTCIYDNLPAIVRTKAVGLVQIPLFLNLSKLYKPVYKEVTDFISSAIPKRCYLSTDARIQARKGYLRVSIEGCSKTICWSWWSLTGHWCMVVWGKFNACLIQHIYEY